MAFTIKSNKTTPQGYYGRLSSTNRSSYSHMTGERKNTKLRAILRYLDVTGGAKRYDVVIDVLGKTGSKRALRGYYSTNFASMRNSGLINLDYDTGLYTIANLGIDALNNEITLEVKDV